MQTDIENQEQEQQAPLFSRLFRPELNLSGQSKKSQIDFGRLDDAQLKGKLQEKNLQGRVGFTGETKEGTSYGFGADLSTSKAKIKTPEELRQFGVPETLEFGSGKLQPRSYDAFMSLQNVFGVDGLEARINAGYTPTEYEKDLKNIGLNLKYRFNKGGTTMKKQMEMFENGGLKDEGGMVDEVSGNDVPPGSTREEVRDDIPAQLSEGEFVFPADVVRYIGLEKLMKMRQQAKQGLKTMEEMGQMGNSEEATMPDDLPFDETDLNTEDLPFNESDLDTEDDLEYNTGGVIEGQQEVYAPGNFGNLVTPNVPEVENVRYYNEQTKQVRMIPHLINVDGSIGNTIYPVPKGFVPQAEAVEEPIKEEKQSGGTQKQQDDNNDNDDPTGDLGGARTTIGGVDYAVQYNFDGTVGLQSLDNYKSTGKRNFQTAKPEIAEAVKTEKTGQITQLGKIKGLGAVAAAEIGKKLGIDTPRYDRLTGTIQKGKAATSFLSKQKPQNIFDIDLALKGAKVKDPAVARVDALTRAQVRSIDEGIRTGTSKENRELGLKASDIAKGADKASRAAEQKGAFERQSYLSSIEAQKTAQEKRDERNNIAKAKAASKARTDALARKAAQRAAGDGGGDGGNQSVSDQAAVADDQGGMFTAVGGLIPKKKKKTKKMKQGGLASRQ